MGNVRFRNGEIVRVHTEMYNDYGTLDTPNWLAGGELDPKYCFWDPSWARIGMINVVRSSEPDGLLLGLVVGALDFSKAYTVPDNLRGQGNYQIYLILIGEGPPLWFKEDNLSRISDEDVENR